VERSAQAFNRTHALLVRIRFSAVFRHSQGGFFDLQRYHEPDVVRPHTSGRGRLPLVPAEFRHTGGPGIVQGGVNYSHGEWAPFNPSSSIPCIGFGSGGPNTCYDDPEFVAANGTLMASPLTTGPLPKSLDVYDSMGDLLAVMWGVCTPDALCSEIFVGRKRNAFKPHPVPGMCGPRPLY
jgi:hypothetical protein